MLGYDYKKFHTHIEYANANGYNAIQESNNDADGFYMLVSYDITPKLTILGRYDIFDYNKHISDDNVSRMVGRIITTVYDNISGEVRQIMDDIETDLWIAFKNATSGSAYNAKIFAYMSDSSVVFYDIIVTFN